MGEPLKMLQADSTTFSLLRTDGLPLIKPPPLSPSPHLRPLSECLALWVLQRDRAGNRKKTGLPDRRDRAGTGRQRDLDGGPDMESNCSDEGALRLRAGDRVTKTERLR